MPVLLQPPVSRCGNQWEYTDEFGVGALGSIEHRKGYGVLVLCKAGSIPAIANLSY